MRRIVSVVLSVVLLLSITAGVDLSAYAIGGGFASYLTPTKNEYTIPQTANQFESWENYVSVEAMKNWETSGNMPGLEKTNIVDVYAKKIGIMDAGLTEYQKIAKIYQYFHLLYTYKVTGGAPDAESFIVRTGYCQTFTWALNALCKRAGIECWAVDAGDGSTFEPHSWNFVKIESKYYVIDIAKEYFLKESQSTINAYGTQYWRFESANSDDTYEAKGADALNKWLAKVGSGNIATSNYSKATIDSKGNLTNPTTGLSTPSVVSTTATSEGVIVKFKGVSNADWYEVWTAPIDGVMNNVSNTVIDLSTWKETTTKYDGDFVYYNPGATNAGFKFSKSATVHSIDKNESGQYQCFIENGSKKGVIVFIVAKNVNGKCNLIVDPTLNTENTDKLMSAIGKNYLKPASEGTDKTTGKKITDATAAQVNSTNYVLYKTTSSGHSYSKVKTIRAAGTGTQGADLYECKNCLQRQVRYTDAKMLSTPKLSAVENTATGVKITWGKVSGASKYRVYYKTTNGSWTKIADTTSTSYTWTGAKSGTKYTFTVRCVDKDGKNFTSDYDKTGKSITYIAAPKLSSVSNVATGVKISWEKSTGAAKYRVFYKTSGGSWTKITDTASTSYTWTKAKSGTKYTFTVRCVDKDGKNYTSSYNSTGKTITYIAAPKLSSVTNTATGVQIKWGKVTGAAKYRVFYKTGNGSWKKLTDTTSTSYTWTGAKSGTKYTFTVRCISKDGKTYTSGYDSKGKSIKFLSAPKISSLTKNSTGITIKWGKVTGAEKYRVFYKTGNGSWQRLTDTTSTSFTWKGGKKGTKYTFTVRCISSDGKTYTSGYDATGKSITK